MFRSLIQQKQLASIRQSFVFTQCSIQKWVKGWGRDLGMRLVKKMFFFLRVLGTFLEGAV